METVLENTEDRNITTRNDPDKLNDRIDSCKKQMFIQQIFLFVDDSTKKSDENQTPDSESANDNTLEPLILMDQLKD